MSSPAWVYFKAANAGLTHFEASVLPFGVVLDQIAVWEIAECGMKPRAKARDVFDI